MSSHYLVAQSRERQRSFARISRYTVKCLESLLDSLGAQLDGLSVSLELKVRCSPRLLTGHCFKTLEVHGQVPNVWQTRQDKRRSHAKIWQSSKRKDFGAVLGVRITR